MKQRTISYCCALVALSILLAAAAFAGNGIVYLNKVDGAAYHTGDTVLAGVPVRVLINMNNSGTVGPGVKVNVANGFVVSSPDGAVWDSVLLDSAGKVTGDPAENQFLLYFNVTPGLGNNIRGNGAPTPDTVGVLCAASGTKGLPTTWNDTSLAIWIFFHDATSHGKHICVDSSFFGAGGTWKWVTVATLTDYFPTWESSVTGQVYDHAGGGFCFLIFDPAQGVNDGTQPNLPKQFALQQNYPNPFNPATIIKFDLPVRSNVTLTIFNVLGQKVKTLLANESLPAEHHSRTWDGTTDDGHTAASGIYFYKIEAGTFVQTKKMVLMK